MTYGKGTFMRTTSLDLKPKKINDSCKFENDVSDALTLEKRGILKKPTTLPYSSASHRADHVHSQFFPDNNVSIPLYTQPHFIFALKRPRRFYFSLNFDYLNS